MAFIPWHVGAVRGPGCNNVEIPDSDESVKHDSLWLRNQMQSTQRSQFLIHSTQQEF